MLEFFHSVYNIWSRAEKIKKSLGGVPLIGMGVSPSVLVLKALAVGIGKQSYAEALARLRQTLVSTSSRRGNSDICASDVTKPKVWSDRGVTGESEDTRFSAKVVTPRLFNESQVENILFFHVKLLHDIISELSQRKIIMTKFFFSFLTPQTYLKLNTLELLDKPQLYRNITLFYNINVHI